MTLKTMDKKFPFIYYTYGRHYFIIGYTSYYRSPPPHQNIIESNIPMIGYNISQNNGDFVASIVYCTNEKNRI